MKTQLINLWESIRTSFWFLPSIMTLLSIVLAFAFTELDRSKDYEILQRLSIFYGGEPEGARTMLSTIAGSMITIAGVIFSITIVALTLASSQFGPRLLRNFMSDTGNQLVLGTFIGTFIYCLLVLQAVRGTAHSVFVPKISVTFSVVLALVSLGVLIYFIHHVAKSIQADSVIEATYCELDEAIERLFPKQDGTSEKQEALQQNVVLDGDGFYEMPCIKVPQSGYLQAIDLEGLLKCATAQNLALKIEYRPGDYVIEGSTLVRFSEEADVPDAWVAKVCATFFIGNQRTPEQDAEFAMNQLVEIAVKALSPGINDPFTAIACIDRLGSALCKVVQRPFPSACVYDTDGHLRLMTKSFTFGSMTKAAFDQIRQYGNTSVAVNTRLLDVLAQIAERSQTVAQKTALRHQATMIERSCRAFFFDSYDRNDVYVRDRHLMQKLALSQSG